MEAASVRHDIAYPIRYETSNILTHVKFSTPSVSKYKLFAFIQLKSNPLIVALKGDKVNTMLLLDNNEYEQKILFFLQEGFV